jgi:glucose/arabinose dehydrogenase
MVGLRVLFPVLATLVSFSFFPARHYKGIHLETIKMPPGFKIAVFADHVPNARSVALGPNGTLFVGTRKAGKVYAILDCDRDNRADDVLTLAEGLNMPNGVAFQDGALLVSDDRAGAIYRISYEG